MTDILTPDEVDAIKRDLDENGHADWCDCTPDFDNLLASHRAQAARIKELEAAFELAGRADLNPSVHFHVDEETDEVSTWILCSDYFVPAADGEDIELSAIPALLDAFKERGYEVFYEWVAKRRGVENKPWR